MPPRADRSSTPTRLKRIQEVKAASTVGEIDLITRGLAAAPAVGVTDVPASPPPVSDPAPPVNPTFQQYTPPVTPPVTEPDPTPPAALNVQYGEPLTPSGRHPGHDRADDHARAVAAAKWVLLVVLIVIAGVAVPVFFGIKAIVDTAERRDRRPRSRATPTCSARTGSPT